MTTTTTREYQREYQRQYAQTPEGRAVKAAHAQRVAAHHKARLAEARADGCTDCGTHEGQLDFHHTDPSTKRFGVGMMKGRSDSLFHAEVAKCVVLCVPCHQERHRTGHL